MATAPGSNDGDWLKYYCIVFGLLILVVGVLYFKIGGDLDDYRAANKRAERDITGKGMNVKRDRDDNPMVMNDIATEVWQYVSAFRDAGGTSGGGSDISDALMASAASEAQMTQTFASSVRTDKVASKNYQTIYRDFQYQACTLEQLIALMWNIENMNPRLRVEDVTWTLADAKVNSEPPFNRITKPKIRVSFREPITSER